jgi:hypothetical protein
MNFSIFLRFSRDFIRISKVTLLLKMHLCNEVPRTFPTLTDMPLDCTKHPRRNWGLAIGSLAWGGGGSGRIPADRRCSRPGRWLDLTIAHLGPRGGRSWDGEITGVGARRGPAAAAAAGGVAGEEGSRLANKRRPCLTRELEEVLGVSAGDEKL